MTEEWTTEQDAQYMQSEIVLSSSLWISFEQKKKKVVQSSTWTSAKCIAQKEFCHKEVIRSISSLATTILHLNSLSSVKYAEPWHSYSQPLPHWSFISMIKVQHFPPSFYFFSFLLRFSHKACMLKSSLEKRICKKKKKKSIDIQNMTVLRELLVTMYSSIIQQTSLQVNMPYHMGSQA